MFSTLQARAFEPLPATCGDSAARLVLVRFLLNAVRDGLVPVSARPARVGNLEWPVLLRTDCLVMGSMSVIILSSAILFLLAIVHAQSPAQAPSVAMAPSAALGASIPVVNIPARVELPKLAVLENRFTLTMGAARITVSNCIECNALFICRPSLCSSLGSEPSESCSQTYKHGRRGLGTTHPIQTPSFCTLAECTTNSWSLELSV